MKGIKEKYKKEIVPEMVKEFGYKSVMAVPQIKKVVINVGIGKHLRGKTVDKQKELIDYFKRDIALLSGQQPIVAKAKKSISGFEIREGDPVGIKVTLRREMMNFFLDKLINIVLPRVRDFQGIESSCIDDSGNLTIGLEEHIVFPEIPADERDFIFGMEISVVNDAKSKEEGEALFRKLGFPIKK